MEVPPRARFARTALAELQRIASHLLWLATHAADVGATAPKPSCLAERERVLALLEPGRGATCCPGGLAADLRDGWAERCRDFLGTFPARIDDWEGMLTENRLWKRRTVGVGVLSPEVALDCGVTGPVLRASGVPRDLRKDRPYEAYGELDFEVPVCRNGDTYDRYRVRVEEMRWAARIVEQCLDRLPEGAVVGPPPNPPQAPRGAEVYHGVEGPRGEIGFHLVGDGTASPGRQRVRPPSRYNLQALPEIARGQTLADLVALVGTLDLGLGELER
ncbi:MAG TPA: NADH-quinone oxidoreductase subunit D [Thermoanaerobaculia bacterium]|nr:NADH-quinone oxidoreductase subunit D [Thermoanaerobaculia bacterium]